MKKIKFKEGDWVMRTHSTFYSSYPGKVSQITRVSMGGSISLYGDGDALHDGRKFILENNYEIY